LAERELGRGEGKSKKEAAQQAADQALRRVREEDVAEPYNTGIN
jgi:dsRNA-specific ribonuclease